MSIEEWGTPISKDKIIYRRNKLIELAKVEATPYTIWYETVNENILDINYMIYEIDRLNNMLNELEKELNKDLDIHICGGRNTGKSIKFGYELSKKELLDKLKELKENK